MGHNTGEWTRAEVYRLSGSNYVSCSYRNEAGSRNYRRADLIRLPLARPEVCDHGTTVCATVSCLVSWAWDHDLLLSRTGAGRMIAETLGLDMHLDPTDKLDEMHYAALALKNNTSPAI